MKRRRVKPIKTKNYRKDARQGERSSAKVKKEPKMRGRVPIGSLKGTEPFFYHNFRGGFRGKKGRIRFWRAFEERKVPAICKKKGGRIPQDDRDGPGTESASSSWLAPPSALAPGRKSKIASDNPGILKAEK